MRTKGTLAQFRGDAKRTRTAAMRRAREEQAFQGTNLGKFCTEISQKRLRWAVKDARRANRLVVRLGKS